MQLSFSNNLPQYGSKEGRGRPSVESLLLRAADVFEFHLGTRVHHASTEQTVAWTADTINGLKAISLLAGIWVEVETTELLEETRVIQGALNDSSLRRATRTAGRRLQSLIGQAELKIGGLRPGEDAEECTDELADELRLFGWRIIAAIAVQHAFLCLLRRRNAVDLLNRRIRADV